MSHEINPFTMDTIMAVVNDHVMPEIERAEVEHGALPEDLARVMTILMEEVGEAAAEALDATRERNSGALRKRAREAYMAEMAQVAAVAIRAIAGELMR